MKFVGFLRGINVGGHRKILMKDLKSTMAQLKFENIQTYIQSGNVVFDAHYREPTVEHLLEKQIKADFGFEVPITLFKKDEFIEGISSNPLRSNEQTSYVVFLKTPPEQIAIDQLMKMNFENDELTINNRFIYLNLSKPFHKSKLNLAFFEKSLGVNATIRNQKTCDKILSMLD